MASPGNGAIVLRMPLRCLLLTVLALPGPLQSGPDAEIRSARERFNRAIAAHDTTAIGQDLADDVRVISSRGQYLEGRAAYRYSLVQQIATRPGLLYVRKPVKIAVQTAWGTATEEGEWTGRWTDPDGPVTVRGTYIAHWRRVDGAWKLSAELFGLTACVGGAYCR